jgi:hypothetical protein
MVLFFAFVSELNFKNRPHVANACTGPEQLRPRRRVRLSAPRHARRRGVPCLHAHIPASLTRRSSCRVFRSWLSTSSPYSALRSSSSPSSSMRALCRRRQVRGRLLSPGYRKLKWRLEGEADPAAFVSTNGLLLVDPMVLALWCMLVVLVVWRPCCKPLWWFVPHRRTCEGCRNGSHGYDGGHVSGRVY